MEGLIRVPVEGGELAVYDSGPAQAPTVLLLHGITASALSFVPVRRALSPAIRTLTVDLRGRGESAELPGPYGIAVHVRDLIAVLDHLEIERVVVAGHSMGATIAARLAYDHPQRVSALVLIDGGLPLPAPPDLDPDVVLEAIIGPAIARLSMEFTSVEDYFEFWRRHPAVGPAWSADVEAYLRYDLTGRPPRLRSRVSAEAVRVDGRDLLVGTQLPLEEVSVPMWLLRAGRGLLDEPGGLIPESTATAAAAAIPHLTLTNLPDLNHYTVVLGSGAEAVAAAIEEAAGMLGP